MGSWTSPTHTEYIKLQDFLKFCNAVESGGMAKNFIVNEEVEVNGEVCTQRGKKLRPGDVVTFLGQPLARRRGAGMKLTGADALPLPQL